MTPPRLRLYLDITDVGERGFEVTVTVQAPQQQAAFYGATNITDAFWHVRDYAARLLWGPTLPPESRDLREPPAPEIQTEPLSDEPIGATEEVTEP